jgi:hypothetical protein
MKKRNFRNVFAKLYNVDLYYILSILPFLLRLKSEKGRASAWRNLFQIFMGKEMKG